MRKQNDPACTQDRGRYMDYQEEELRWAELAICMRSAVLPVEAMVEYPVLFWRGDEIGKDESDDRRIIAFSLKKQGRAGLQTAKEKISRKRTEKCRQRSDL